MIEGDTSNQTEEKSVRKYSDPLRVKFQAVKNAKRIFKEAFKSF